MPREREAIRSNEQLIQDAEDLRITGEVKTGDYGIHVGTTFFPNGAQDGSDTTAEARARKFLGEEGGLESGGVYTTRESFRRQEEESWKIDPDVDAFNH